MSTMSTMSAMLKGKALAASEINAFWQQRNRREQLWLALMGGVLLLTLWFLLLINPALDARRHLQRELPALRRQQAELQLLLAQAAQDTTAAGRSATGLAQSAIEQALLRNGQRSRSIVVSDQSARLDFSEAAFSSLIGFLVDVQRIEGWQVSAAKMTATARPDVVDASITLVQKGSQ